MSGHILSVERDSFTSRFRMIAGRNKVRPKFGCLLVGETVVNNSATVCSEGTHQGERVAQHSSSCVPTMSPPLGQEKSAHSILKMACEMRAHRIKFYRNGDRFFKGMIFAVSPQRIRTFESLLCALTSSPLCDSKVMPNGVRYVYTLDGARVQSLAEVHHGSSYVCSSGEAFRSLDYANNEDPVWNANSLTHVESNHTALKTKGDKVKEDNKWPDSENLCASSALEQTRPNSDEKSKTSRIKSIKSEMFSSDRKAYEEYQRTFIVPRLITVIRNGRRPRKAIRILLNKKTAQTFDQVMVDITEAIKLDCGRVNKVYMITGQQVMCLADFFQKETLFLACGLEKIVAHDFTLDMQEIKQIHPFHPCSSRRQERNLHKRSHQMMAMKSDAKDNGICEVTGLNTSKPVERDIKAVNKNNIDTYISQMPIPLSLTNKYEVGTLIGTGNFAIVMECKEKKTNRKFALKIINKENCKGKEEMIDNEVRILRCVKHPNIIRLVEDYTNQHHIFYIMELVKGGDLFDAISSSNGRYTEQDASDMLYNLANALQYLHGLSIVHRDVKPENILIKQHDDGTKSLKLGDFGLATEVRGPLYAVCGTPTYVAPEVIAETGYGLKIDVWSAGVIAYILLCGFPPFSSLNDDQDELFDLIMSGCYDYPSPYWDAVSDTAKNVISAMLEVNPEIRLSSIQVLEHKWIACDTQGQADLRSNVSKGLSTYFRRETRPQQNYAGIKVMATTALDKASKFFRGRGTYQHTVRSKDLIS